ncbi:angiopoietin-4-like [Ochlerotatus camptorhynchus]|uniref:angiopoietin-4-like n=1 Tax=Ochlerotatus camptorhynchus TaxID=644619 RepID=UPI0031DF295B
MANLFTVALVLTQLVSFLSVTGARRLFRSCNDVPAVSGIYDIRPINATESFEVYCEQGFGGRWLVLQNRYDGSESFNRSWADYKSGFGVIGNEFWLGLDKLHQITSADEYELMVWMGDFKDFEAHQKYKLFAVANEADNYRLTLDGWRDGTAGESHYVYRDQQFTTFDRDNDKSIMNCAVEMGSGYWHLDCGTGINRNNLNGIYSEEVLNCSRGMWWGGFGAEQNPLKWTKMMIRTRVSY